MADNKVTKNQGWFDDDEDYDSEEGEAQFGLDD